MESEKHDVDDDFGIVRIIATIKALAHSHDGEEDRFRAAQARRCSGPDFGHAHVPSPCPVTMSRLD
ncbi:MAG: hypothetical protein FWD68_09640 [Alphaproteobacteria bacterium]|nr:hypothetical protein [Alphaproteobacteria bacterium]